jgi:hypothetical protein
MSDHIQSVVFPKSDWTLLQAKSWLRRHGYKVGLDEKPNVYRFRQFDPKPSHTYRTKKIRHETKSGKSKLIKLIVKIKAGKK